MRIFSFTIPFQQSNKVSFIPWTGLKFLEGNKKQYISQKIPLITST